MVSKRKTKHPHSYNLFFKLNYESFRRAFPLMKYRDVRVILGKIWKQLPIERKNEYYPIENKIPPRKRVKSKREYKKSVPTKTMVTRSSSRLRESSSIASSDVISSEDNLAQPETGNVVAEKAIEETNHLVDACVKKPNSKPATDFRSKAQNVAEKSTEENSYSLGNLEIQVAEIMEAPNEVNSNEDLPSGPSTSRDVTRENTGIEPYINGPTPMNALVDVNLCMDYLDNFYYTMRNIVFPGLLGSRVPDGFFAGESFNAESNV